PDKVHWFTVRAHGIWPPIAFLAFLIGAALPFLAILNPAVRRSPRALRVVGGFVLLGTLLHVIWLVAPVFGVAVIPWTVFALAAMLSIALVLSRLDRGVLHGHA